MIKAVLKAAPTTLPELTTYLQPFANLFRRCWRRQSLDRYVTGLLTDLAHKTCDTMADAVAGTSTERLQHFLTDAAWDAVALDRRRVAQLQAVSPPGGMLAIDDTTFPKQGFASVGVSRQYCSVLGKVANCQTLVTAEYIADAPTTSTPIHWPVTAQLYVPHEWLSNPKRRTLAHIPDTVYAQRKHDVALAVIDRARAWDVPFRLVLADAGYGRIAAFIKGLEERHLLYVCGVDKAFGVRHPEEVVRAQRAAVPQPNAKAGRPRKVHPAPLVIVRKIFADPPATHWQTITWREGSRSSMRKQFVALPMHWGTGEEARSTDDPRVYTSAEEWLIGAHSIDGQTEETKYYFSNLPTDTPLTQLAAFVRARWPIEQFYEEAKQECGLGDYQGRRWDGLHRHVALVMVVYSFLVCQRMMVEACRAERFLPAVRRHSLAALHRTVLVWLLQDLVQWWIATEHIKTFRPRRY